MITEEQKDYIKRLSSYPDTKEQDEVDIENFLKECGKKTFSELSKEQGSELIKILLRRPAEYTFACGKKAILHKREANCYHVLGDLEGCMHACPDEAVSDVNNCPYWKNHMNRS